MLSWLSPSKDGVKLTQTLNCISVSGTGLFSLHGA